MFYKPKIPYINGILAHMQMLTQELCLLESLGCTPHVFVLMHHCQHPFKSLGGLS